MGGDNPRLVGVSCCIRGSSGAASKPPPTVEPLAAEPPMTGAEPLVLLRQVRFEGLLLVADSDMIVVGGMN